MVSNRTVLVAALVPVAVVLLVALIIVIGRANSSDTPDCSTSIDGVDSLTCARTTPPTPFGSPSAG